MIGRKKAIGYLTKWQGYELEHKTWGQKATYENLVVANQATTEPNPWACQQA